MENKEFLSVFKNLFPPHHDIHSFRLIFIKAAWKAYNDLNFTSIQIDQFQTIITPLFNTLFVGNGEKINDVMIDVNNLLVTPQNTKQFFSNTFYLVLSHYIKSFYGNDSGWEKIISFTQAIEHFLSYVSNRSNENDSFFIFEDTLITALEELRQQNKEIMVLNTYCGVPIQFKARIIHTDTQSIMIKPHPIQETAAILQNGIYILKNDQFVNDVYAAVTPKIVNGERLLELTRFDELETSLYHRQSVRVHPSKPYHLKILHTGIELGCDLFDISIGGVAATNKRIHSIANNAMVTLRFPAEIMGQTCDVEGVFVFISSFEGGHKYHFKMNLNKQQESDLGKYIAKREQEIIKKLREEII